MHKVFQTITTPDSGNCFPACVASIMKRPLWTVPNFCVKDHPHTGHWSNRFLAWLDAQGWGYIEVDFREISKTCSVWMPDALCIVSGKSPRGDWNHSIVGRFVSVNETQFEVHKTHDPSPAGGGVETVEGMMFLFQLPQVWEPRRVMV